MESPSFDKWKSAVRIDSGDGRWNVKRLAAYSIFAAAFLAAPGIAAAQDSATGKVSFGKCQACHAVGPGAKNKLGPELNGLVGRRTCAAGRYQYSPAVEHARLQLASGRVGAFIAD